MIVTGTLTSFQLHAKNRPSRCLRCLRAGTHAPGSEPRRSSGLEHGDTPCTSQLPVASASAFPAGSPAKLADSPAPDQALPRAGGSLP